MRQVIRSAATLCVVVTLAASQQAPADPLRYGVTVPPGAVGVVDGQVVTARSFIDAMMWRYARPKSRDGQDILRSLKEEALVKARTRRQGIAVSSSEVTAYVRSLDERSRKASGLSVRELLARDGQSYETFLRKVPHVVGLGKLARRDFKVPAGKPVSEFHMKLWMQQNLKTARVVADKQKLPAGTIISVEGEPVSELAFMSHLLGSLDPKDVRRVVTSLLQEVVMGRMLGRYGHVLNDGDVMTEFLIRKRIFESNPVYKGVKYEDVLREQTGFTADELRQTQGFRVHAGVGYLARTLYTRQILEARYRDHQSRYGPVLACRHILVQASDNPKLRGKMRSFAEARRTAEDILQQIRKGTSFPDAARLYSSDQATRYKGGVLPTFTPGRTRFEPTFVQAANALKPGDVSEPVRSSVGWHLIKVDERRPAPPLDEVSEDLSRFLASKQFLREYKESKVGVHVSKQRLGIRGS